MVELLETATYLICQDEDVTAEYFLKILTTLNVPTKLFRAADKDGDGDLSISEVMNFLLVLTISHNWLAFVVLLKQFVMIPSHS